MREIRIPLEQPKGLRKLRAAQGDRHILLRGQEVTVVHPGVLAEPLTLASGLVDLALVDRGSGDGRFPVLHRMTNGKVIPREHGIEGWLWTRKAGSAYPMLSEREDDVPNLALLFVKPLPEEDVARAFLPGWVKALAEGSPLGKPSVLGLLASVEQVLVAEAAFREFGALGEVTDREVPPTHRRHLPTDKPANPSFTPDDAGRAQTSIAPPGMG